VRRGDEDRPISIVISRRPIPSGTRNGNVRDSGAAGGAGQLSKPAGTVPGHNFLTAGHGEWGAWDIWGMGHPITAEQIGLFF
jgi:hypothetical protein